MARGITDSEPLERFERLVNDDLLPDFCRKTGIDSVGFRGLPDDLDAAEVGYFMTALTESVVGRRPGARFIMPQSRASIALFWEGNKAFDPRPIQFARETLWSCGGAAQLHLEHSWPLSLLGVESKDRAFDLVAVRPDDVSLPWIAAEVKPSRRLLERLLDEMASCMRIGRHERESCGFPGHQKFAGLARSRAPVFWGLAPHWTPVFSVMYDDRLPIELRPATHDVLGLPTAPSN